MSKIVEQYMLQHQLYSGPTCETFRATHLATQQQCAVKVFKFNEFIGSQLLQDSIINQVQNLKKMQCEFIIKFHKMLKTQNNIYLVYQFCPDGTLQARLTQRALSPVQILSLLKQIALALRCLHDKNIIHCEVQPSSILISGETFKLSNFVSCRFTSQPGTLRDLSRINLNFASPEIKKQQPPSRASDIYSLGMIAKHVSEGQPFRQNLVAMIGSMTDTNPKKRLDISQVLQQITMLSSVPKSLDQKDIKQRATSFVYKPARRQRQDKLKQLNRLEIDISKFGASETARMTSASKSDKDDKDSTRDINKVRMMAMFCLKVAADACKFENAGMQQLTGMSMALAAQLYKGFEQKKRLDFEKLGMLRKQSQLINSKLKDNFIKTSLESYNMLEIVRNYLRDNLHQEDRKTIQHLFMVTGLLTLESFFQDFLQAGVKLCEQPLLGVLEKMSVGELKDLVRRRMLSL